MNVMILLGYLVLFFIGSCIWFGIGYFATSMVDYLMWKNMDYKRYCDWSMMNGVNDVREDTYQFHPNFFKAIMDECHRLEDLGIAIMAGAFFPIVISFHMLFLTIATCYNKLDGHLSNIEGLTITREVKKRPISNSCNCVKDFEECEVCQCFMNKGG